jgi:glycosyltransferase involved in cell wall biosynthesis
MSEGVIHIGFLGRLVPVKQVPHMLEMMQLLESVQPGRWALHIIGDGPLREELEDQAAATGPWNAR